MLALSRSAPCRAWPLLLIVAASTPSPAAKGAQEIQLATWNMEWLIAPATFRALRTGCAPEDEPVRGSERRLPCNVAFAKERSAHDFAVLGRYARELDAHVVALQEVDGAEAAALVFPGYAFCFTQRRHLQNTGFAIRPGIPHRCGADERQLALGDALRRGAELVLYPGTPRELRLLSIHLKSGCARDPLTSGRRECAELARQTSALEAWIDTQARLGRRFAVLGDFNRDLLRDARAASHSSLDAENLWAAIDDGEPPEADLVNALHGQRFVNCAAGQPFRTFIDFIVLSRTLGTALVPGSYRRITYRPADVARSRLSDHCPIAVSLRY